MECYDAAKLTWQVPHRGLLLQPQHDPLLLSVLEKRSKPTSAYLVDQKTEETRIELKRRGVLAKKLVDTVEELHKDRRALSVSPVIKVSAVS